MQTKAASLGLTLLGDVDFCDVTLVCGDGSHLPCHRAVLASASTFLRQILYESLQQRTLLFLGQVEVEEVRALLELLYTGTSSLTQDRLPSLQALATNLRLEALTNTLDNIHQQLTANGENGTIKDDTLSDIIEDNFRENMDEMATKPNGLTDFEQTIENTVYENLSKTEAARLNQNVNDKSEQIISERVINDLIIKEEIDELRAPSSRNGFCPHCFQVIRGSNLKRHINRHHKSHKPNLKCDDCGDPFTSNEGLIGHKKKNRCRADNAELFPELCNRGCGKRFKALYSVRKHRKVCPVKLKCHKCEEDFAKITKLAKHMKSCQVMGEVEDNEEFGIRVNKRTPETKKPKLK